MVFTAVFRGVNSEKCFDSHAMEKIKQWQKSCTRNSHEAFGIILRLLCKIFKEASRNFKINLLFHLAAWNSKPLARVQKVLTKKIFIWWPSPFKGTQDWEFFWLRFWNLRYFFVRYVKILRFYKKKFLIAPLLGEVRFFRVVLGLRGMKKNFEVGPKNFFFLLPFWTLNMTQY